ncbi:conserved hypothetical protein [Talaromyces stipitatus ATCC 10500]|uniref:RTA1 domain protein n=1 Tax=Talaromyces stipitatus (strain ATCC 10500 / CBS 375.48 / QM 6759 / NRRL 1006) TaxID=441959 RepID=B8M7J2_TALSN|nr:uncharacterized protein TSTA_028340 [Talaromyces stipitatus ATCC 10500]EED19545.1 conserved hypothetical protein [Talaromyces stipitatus ATCC 10500]
MAKHNVYKYDPSKAAAMAFAIIFSITSLIHLVQLARKRTWYFIPFLIGGIFETVGYGTRYYNATQTPDWALSPYIIQFLLLLLAPSLFAASIYMILGRIVRLLDGASRSLVRPSWMTKIFVTGDVLSFFLQCGGGGILAQAKTPKTTNLGNDIIIVGLLVQLVFFGFFIVVSIVFHRRMLASPTNISQTVTVPWSRYMMIMYTVSGLIMVRSIYRVIEYVQGPDGGLQAHEAYLYVFDSSLMLLCCLIFNVSHPSQIIVGGGKNYRKMSSDLEMLSAPDRN